MLGRHSMVAKGRGGEVLDDAIHGGGCPVEQVGEDMVDGVAPEEEPPEEGAHHEEIDEEGDGKVAGEGKEGYASEVVCHEWGCEEGAEEGDKQEAPKEA